MTKDEGFQAMSAKVRGSARTGLQIEQSGLWDGLHVGSEGEEEERIDCVTAPRDHLILSVSGFRYSFFVAMGYLTICHISRIYIFHYGILTTDFSG